MIFIRLFHRETTGQIVSTLEIEPAISTRMKRYKIG